MFFTDELNIQKHTNLNSNAILIFEIYCNIRYIYIRDEHTTSFVLKVSYCIRLESLSSTISLEYQRIVVILAPRR